MNTLEILQNRLLQQKKQKFKKTLTTKMAAAIANKRLGGTWAVAKDTRRLGETKNLVIDIYKNYYETTRELQHARIRLRGSDVYVWFPIKKFQQGKCPEIYLCGITSEYFHSDYIRKVDALYPDGGTVSVAYDYCLYHGYIFNWADNTIRTYRQPEQRTVGRYHSQTRPAWWKSKQGMGMELEINSNDRHKLATVLSPEMLIEYDGSLHADKGVELIGGPYTLKEYQAGETPWDNTLAQIKEIGGDGHNATGGSGFYGIHLSLTKSLFTSFHGAKFILFFNQQAELCQLIGQRKQLYGRSGDNGYHIRKKLNQCLTYDTGAATKYVRDTNGRAIFSHKVNSYAANYSNVETTKYEPVRVDDKRYEVRIFRSNLRRERILKNVEFVDAVRVYTKTASALSVSTPYQGTADFLYWLGKQPGYTTLKKFLVDNAQNFTDNHAHFRANKNYKNLSQLVSFKLNPKIETVSDL